MSKKLTFDLYLVCTIAFGWILFTWITFLEESLKASDELNVFISVFYLVIVGLALVAAAARKPRLLLVTTIVCCVLLGAFMLVTDYWRFWTQLNASLSLLCAGVAFYIHRHKDPRVPSGQQQTVG